MDWIHHSVRLIPLLPLFGAAFNLLLGKKAGKPAVYAVACGTVFASFLLSVAAFLALLSMPAAQRVFTDNWYTWIKVGDFRANAAFLVDPLSAVMILVVTGVGFLIHVYSIGYMGEDKSVWRYFGFLNLFVFAMLTLVLADNFLLMFIGWEGVGLCSYLLIGFWYTEKKNTDAGKKAFVVNRIGDWAFLAGVLLLFWELGQRTGIWSISFLELKSSVYHLQGATVGGVAVVTLVGILLFIGATGKSAQIPLYVWLPDAMAGPTPVSALIHAATMVTAGVYMIGRVHFIYDMSPVALSVVAVVGGVTALFAATIGLVQNDIKKVLAYSTVSQLGYMFLAMGVGAYSAGIFHLMTHAFFKACLFLGSGSVILACHHEQDIQKMGGLRKWMPTTYWTFLVSTLAIAGIFPFSGFFSKDEILWQSFASRHGNPILWVLGVAAAFMTAFYMFRLVYLTFHGAYRGGHEARTHHPLPEHARDLGTGHHGPEADAMDDTLGLADGAAPHGHGHAHVDDHHAHGGTPHESPRVITVPLQILAVLALLAGFLNVPAVLGHLVGWKNSDTFSRWLEPSITASAVRIPTRQEREEEEARALLALKTSPESDATRLVQGASSLTAAVRAAGGLDPNYDHSQDSVLAVFPTTGRHREPAAGAQGTPSGQAAAGAPKPSGEAAGSIPPASSAEIEPGGPGSTLAQAVEHTIEGPHGVESPSVNATGSAPAASSGGTAAGPGTGETHAAPGGAEAHAAGETGEAHAGETGESAEAEVHNPVLEFGLMILSLIVAFGGIGLAVRFYLKNTNLPKELARKMRGVYNLLLNKYWVDEIYQVVVIDNFYRLMRLLAWFDMKFVDGLVNLAGRLTVLWSWLTGKVDNIVVDGWGVNGLADSIMNAGRSLRQIQTGKVQGYLMIGLLGILAIIVLRIL